MSQGEPYLVSFTPDGRHLVLGSGGGPYLLWDLATGRETREIKLKKGYYLASLSADGRRFIAVGPREKGLTLIEVWDFVSGEWLLKVQIDFPLEGRPTLSPDGRFFVTDDDRSFWEGPPYARGSRYHERKGPALWDANTGKHLGTLIGHTWDYRGHALSPDGKYIATAASDSSVLLWDVAAVIRTHPNPTAAAVVVHEKGTRSSRPPPREPPAEKELTAKEVGRLWADLADEDAAKAFKAMWAVVLHPKSALPLVRKNLKAVANPKPEDIARLVGELDSNDFATRQRATAELSLIADVVAPQLREARKGTTSKEVQRRLDAVLKHAGPLVTNNEKLRRLRAIEALEHIGTKEAKAILEEVARGAPAALETQSARESLARLAKRVAP